MKQNILTLIRDFLEEQTRVHIQKEKIPLSVYKNVTHKFSDGIENKGNVISVVPGFGDWWE